VVYCNEILSPSRTVSANLRGSASLPSVDVDVRLDPERKHNSGSQRRTETPQDLSDAQKVFFGVCL